MRSLDRFSWPALATWAAVASVPLAAVAWPRAGVAGEDGRVDSARKAERFLARHCARCHAGGETQGGIGFMLDARRLVEMGRVVPGKPDRSSLLEVVANHTMPDDDKTKPTEDEIADLKAWIESGAPAFRAPATLEPRSPEQVVDAIAKDLGALDAGARPFARYFTLAHLRNAGRSEDELTTYRTGLSKLVNSLSWKKTITVPAAVDAERTIYRIDLRDYDWTQATWQTILARYPLGVTPATAQAKKCANATGCELAWIRADWFLAAAPRAPLYNQILELPQTDSELEHLLGVDVAADQKSGAARRAGFHTSGVDDHNRMVERHPSRYGAYWKSYEFHADDEATNLHTRPLGPGKGDWDFQQDGSEILFNLPNGLQAFMVVTAEGERLDRVPVHIGWHKDMRAGSVEIVNGVSCMSCHAQGIRADHEDEIRGWFQTVGISDEARYFKKEVGVAVKALYADKKEMKELVAKDRARYRAAVELTGAPLGTKTEPVASLAAQFSADLDAKTAAAELGLSEAAFAERQKAAPVAAFAPLAQGQAVARGTFVKGFEEAAKAWKLGTQLGHVALDAELAELPQVPGRQRFEAPFGDRVLSVDVDRDWKFESRRNGLTITREGGAKINLTATRSNTPDLDALLDKEKDELGTRLVEFKTIDDPKLGSVLVLRSKGTVANLQSLDLLTIRAPRIFRITCESTGDFEKVRPELERVLASARIGGGGADEVARAERDMPSYLKPARFESDLDAALARAKAENKLVLLYVKPHPSYFTCPYCQTLERNVFTTEAFRDSAKDFVPLRLEVLARDPLVKMLKFKIYPSLRVLNAQGAVLAEPKERTVEAIEKAFAIARKLDADFKAKAASSDLSSPDARAQLIEKHLQRFDGVSAVEVYNGFPSSDTSPARYGSLVKLTKFLLALRKSDEVMRLVDAASGAFSADQLVPLTLETYGFRIDRAYELANKDLCFRLLDEVAEKYPESDLGKKRDERKAWIQAHPPKGTNW